MLQDQSEADVNNFVEKINFDDKLKKLNKRFTSNKAKHIETEKKLAALKIKLHNYQKKDTIFG